MKKYLFALTLINLVQLASGQLHVDNFSTIAMNIVKINNETTNESGVGFIIGRDDQNFFIATAKHVVEGATEITGVFENGSGFQKQSMNVHTAHEYYDFAICTVEVNGLERASPKFVSNIEVGDKIGFIGINMGKKILPENESGLIFSLDHEYLIVKLKRVEQGDSGSPLLCQEGIVGMIFQRSPVQVLNINLIKSIVEEWGMPWLLKEVRIHRPTNEKVTIPNALFETSLPITKVTLKGDRMIGLDRIVDKDVSTVMTFAKDGWKQLELTLQEASNIRYVKLFYPSRSSEELPVGEIELPLLRKKITFNKALTLFKEHEYDGDWYIYDLGKYYITHTLILKFKVKKDLSTDVITPVNFYELKITGPKK